MCKKKYYLTVNVEHIDSLLKVSGDSLALKTHANALWINLDNETYSEYRIPEIYLTDYFGGIGLGLRLYQAFSESDEKALVITYSDLLNTDLPFSDQTVFTFRSPQSGIVMHNFLPGKIGRFFSSSGYYAVIITGTASSRKDIFIESERIVFSESKVGADSKVGDIVKLYGEDVLTSGPSAEYSIPYSSCVYNSHLSGRGGLGLLLVRKNIKVIKFASETVQADYPSVSAKLKSVLNKDIFYHKYLNAGSSVFISDAVRRGWAPVCNFKYRTDPRLMFLCPDEIIEKYGSVKSVFPDFNSLLMLGSNIGSFDLNRISERYGMCLEYAIDPVSAGRLFKGGKVELSYSDLKDDNLLSKNDVLMISNMECGPFDYRGAHEQALINSFGFFIPLYKSLVNSKEFDLSNLNNLLHEYAFEMGLQCLNIDSKLNAFLKSKKFLTDSLSLFAGRDIFVDSITQYGKRYLYLFYQTEIVYRGIRLSIPDYFSMVLESNYKKASVFRPNVVINEFRKKLELISQSDESDIGELN